MIDNLTPANAVPLTAVVGGSKPAVVIGWTLAEVAGASTVCPVVVDMRVPTLPRVLTGPVTYRATSYSTDVTLTDVVGVDIHDVPAVAVEGVAGSRPVQVTGTVATE